MPSIEWQLNHVLIQMLRKNQRTVDSPTSVHMLGRDWLNRSSRRRAALRVERPVERLKTLQLLVKIR